MSLVSTLSKMVTVLLVFFSMLVGAHSQEPDSQLGLVRAGVEASRSSWQDISLTMSICIFEDASPRNSLRTRRGNVEYMDEKKSMWQSHADRANGLGLVNVTSWPIDYHYKSSGDLLWVSYAGAPGSSVQLSTTSYNGTDSRNFIEIEGQISAGNSRYSGTIAPDRSLPYRVSLLHFVMGGGIGEGESLSKLLRLEGTKLIDANVELDGLTCSRVLLRFPNQSEGIEFEIFLAEDRNWMPARQEIRTELSNGEVSLRTIEVKEWEQHPDGWFPKLVETVSYYADGTIKRLGVYQISDVVFNEGLSVDDFSIDFPNGTTVHDLRAGRGSVYVVGGE